MYRSWTVNGPYMNRKRTVFEPLKSWKGFFITIAFSVCYNICYREQHEGDTRAIRGKNVSITGPCPENDLITTFLAYRHKKGSLSETSLIKQLIWNHFP